MSALRRPRDVAGVRAALAHLHSPESVAAVDALNVRPDDVFIATYPKSGTTWLQQMVHTLRGGSMDFAEICAVVPWMDTALDLGIPLDGPQPGAFRAFKTHRHWPDLPRGGRAIYAIRDPRDVLVSFHRFFEGWMFEAGSIDLETFARDFFLVGTGSGRWWDHVRGWWPATARPDVLCLCFEDLRADLEAGVARVADFLGVDEPDLRARAVERSRFDFMKAHGAQFDDHLLREARNPACGLPAGQTSKLRDGRVGGHRQALSAATRALLDTVWMAEIAAPLGFADYDALRAAVNQRARRVVVSSSRS